MAVPRVGTIRAFAFVLLFSSLWPVRGFQSATHIRSDTSMVLVPVQVSTRDGAPILDLPKESFHVFEESQEQTISYFAKDDAPVSIGLLFDSSASMTKKKSRALDAAKAFFGTAAPDDEFFLIEFDEDARLEVPFTMETGELYDEIKRTRPFGRTSLYDAIHLGINVMKKARYERKALVIVSDGADNRSRRNFTFIRNAISESRVQLYSMGITSPVTVEEDGLDRLGQLAELSGGRHFAVTPDTLTQVSARIGQLLRERYLLGYVPLNDIYDGKYRRLSVTVSGDAGNPFRVLFRPGYVASDR